jgi:hypothetical protein
VRTLSAAVQAAVSAGNGVPDFKVELIDWVPHYAAAFSGGPAGRTGAVIAGDGALVQVYDDGAGQVFVRRVTDPTQVSWPAWLQLTTTARASGEVCLANIGGGTIRVFWQDSGTTNIVTRDSTDNGVTWSAAANLFDAGAAVAGIAADGVATQVFVLYLVGGNWRGALWTSGTPWTKADWTLGDSFGAGGLGVVRQGGGSYIVVAALEATSSVGFAMQSTIYNGAWSAFVPVFGSDLSAGLAPQDPHLAFYDGLYHLCYGLTDSGSISGLASTRAAVCASLDGIHWSDPLEDGNSYAHGAVALKHTSGYLLAAPDVSALAPLYTASASQYRDCSADVSHIEVVQTDGSPAKVTVTLANDAGQYSNLASLRPNARLRLSLGYAGAGLGTVYTHVGYVESWTFDRAADVSSVVIVARDATSFLDRQARTSLTYTGRTVDWLVREVLSRAGLFNFSVAATSQFSQTISSFQQVAGHTWRSVLLRLSRIYGFDYAARAAADGTDSVSVIEKNPADAVAWVYTDPTHDGLVYSIDGLRSNHVLVFGQPATPAYVGEAWDFADVGSVGQERLLLVVEPEIASGAAAGIRAGLDMNQEKRRGVAGHLAAAMHPGLELWDVVSISDGLIGAHNARVSHLQHQYDAAHAIFDIVVGLEGV